MIITFSHNIILAVGEIQYSIMHQEPNSTQTDTIPFSLSFDELPTYLMGRTLLSDLEDDEEMSYTSDSEIANSKEKEESQDSEMEPLLQRLARRLHLPSSTSITPSPESSSSSPPVQPKPRKSSRSSKADSPVNIEQHQNQSTARAAMHSDVDRKPSGQPEKETKNTSTKTAVRNKHLAEDRERNLNVPPLLLGDFEIFLVIDSREKRYDEEVTVC